MNFRFAEMKEMSMCSTMMMRTISFARVSETSSAYGSDSNRAQVR